MASSAAAEDAPVATSALHVHDARRWLAHELRAWLNTRSSRGYRLPLLPRFPAQFISAVRALIVMGATAAFLLNPSTATLLRGSVLLPVSAVICIQSNLGASLQTAYRVTSAAIVALMYNLFIINVLPISVFVAIPATALAAAVISYTETHALTKRFCLAGVIVVLLNSFDSSSGAGVVDNRYCMEVSGCIAIGSLLGLLVQLLPLPAVPTAANEVITRLAQLSRSVHNQVAALALAFTHAGTVHNLHTADAQARLQVVKEMVTVLDEEVVVDMAQPHGRELASAAPPMSSVTDSSTPANSAPAPRLPSMGSDELYESLQAGAYAAGYGERTPMLRADVEDMHAVERAALPLLIKSVADMAFEPTIWLRPIKRALTHAIKRVLATCGAPEPKHDFLHGGLSARLHTWAVSSNRLHRIVRAMMVAEQAVHASHLHAQFLQYTQNAVCRLVLASAEYHAAGVEHASALHLRWLTCRGCPAPACGDAAARRLEEELISRRDAVEDALSHFFECFQRARVDVLYNEHEILGSRRDLFAGASIQQQAPSAHVRAGRPPQPGWHAKDLFAVLTFYFTVLRSVQTVMATVHATCALSGVADHAVHTSSLVMNSPSVDGFVAGPTQDHKRSEEVATDATTTGVRSGHCCLPQYACMRCTVGAVSTFAHFREAVSGLGSYIVTNLGLHASWRQTKRAIRVSLGVTLAAILGEVTRYAFGSTFVFWAPVTVAFMSGGSEGGAYRTSVLRLLGTLVGASVGYVCIRLSSGDRLAVGILLSLWVAAMQFPRTSNIAQGYWAIVAAFTAAIIVLGAGGDNVTASALALTRIEQTWLGIVVYIVVCNGVLPVSARQLVRLRVVAALTALDTGLTQTVSAFTEFITRESLQHVADVAATGSASALSSLLAAHAGAPPTSPTTGKQHDLTDPTSPLLTVDAFELAFSDLLDEAAAEPNLWRPEFGTLHQRYTELGLAVKRTVRGIRLLYQCLVALRAQARMFAEERDGRVQGASSSQRSRGLHEQGLPHAVFTAQNAHAVDSTAYYDPNRSSSHGILAFSPFVEAIQRLQTAAHTALELVIVVMNTVDSNNCGAICQCSDSSGCCTVNAAADVRTDADIIRPTPARGEATDSVRTLSSQTVLDPVAALAASVDKLVSCMVDYVEEYNEFMHSHIVAVVVKHRRAAALRRVGSVVGRDAATESSTTPLADTDAPWLLLSNLDSLCMSTSSFALRELAAGVADVARIARRTHHARVKRFDW